MSRALSRTFPPRISFPSSLLATASLLCVLTVPRLSWAEESVQLVSAEASHPQVEEILLRARAELRSVGFSVTRCPLTGGDELCAAGQATGRLEMIEQDGRLQMRASGPGTMAPLTQELDLSAQGISPEVAAIRAVELLRATLLLSLRDGRLEVEEGGTVQRFTAWEQEEEVEPEPPVSEPPPPITPETPREPSEPWRWAAGIGPTFSLPGASVPPGWGGEFFVDAAHRWFYFGAAFDAALLPAPLQRPEGRTDVTSISATFRIGWSAPCGKKWVCRLGPHIGVLQFDIQTDESEAFSADDARHLTFVVGGDATLARYLSKGFGVFLRGRLGAAGESARLELSTPVTLGRPISGVSLGATFR